MGTQIPNLNYKSLAEVPKDFPLVPTPDVTVEWLRIDERAVVPQYAHDGDMCFDLKVIIDDAAMKPFVMSDSVHAPESTENLIVVQKMGELNYVTLEPGQSLTFHTGLKCATPYGWGMNVFVRSSTGIKSKLRLCNGTGKIDTSQYRGEILIGLHNFGAKAKKIFDGDRVAQAEIIKVWRVHNTEVKELSSTERGTGGFGSSGSK